MDLSELMNGEGWKFDKLQQVLPARTVEHIELQMSNFVPSSLSDRPWWLLTNTEKFKVSSAWELLRDKEEENIQYNQI